MIREGIKWSENQTSLEDIRKIMIRRKASEQVILLQNGMKDGRKHEIRVRREGKGE